jgi:hypothetical protein
MSLATAGAMEIEAEVIGGMTYSTCPETKDQRYPVKIPFVLLYLNQFYSEERGKSQ